MGAEPCAPLRQALGFQFPGQSVSSRWRSKARVGCRLRLRPFPQPRASCGRTGPAARGCSAPPHPSGPGSSLPLSRRVCACFPAGEVVVAFFPAWPGLFARSLVPHPDPAARLRIIRAPRLQVEGLDLPGVSPGRGRFRVGQKGVPGRASSGCACSSSLGGWH